MDTPFKPGELVRTIGAGHLYEVKSRADGYVLCNPLTFNHFEGPFVFKSHELIMDNLLCAKCNHESPLIHDEGVTGNQWACLHKFCSIGYEKWKDNGYCPSCKLNRPYHSSDCVLMSVANKLNEHEAIEVREGVGE